MNKIGFIDYYLDEWHAHQYVKWIPEAAKGGQFEVAYAWAQIDRRGGTSTEEWCKNNQVKRAISIEELVDKCDSIVVLSPDHPEMHAHLSEVALSSGKPVYIDKTFTLDLESARQMFLRAEKCNTPMYSTSALRYAPELTQYNGPGTLGKDIALVAARGPGEFRNYSVHQLEMVVKSIGLGAKRGICTVSGSAPMVTYDYGDGRYSIVHCMPWTSTSSLEIQAKNGEGISLSISGGFWPVFIDHLLDFFASKEAAVYKEETLEVVSLVETGLRTIERPGQWISIDD
ncbi:MAG: hypothetical protein PHP79_09350 [Clostridia bacterium]|nr:hypothetical protein [Clostridia bacterium]